MARPDLIALTDDGLIQLSNAGLVKRALREVAGGQGPEIEEGDEGTITARFADGTLTRLPPGKSPADATCTCPAGGMCRHRVALVVAYRAASVSGAPATDAVWDPGTLDGMAFEAGLNTSAAAELKRLLDGGIIVGLERGTVPVARLPTASVRFLVPGEIGYARCDCVAGGGCAHVALAIRAFRAAGDATEVRLGGKAAAPAENALLALVEKLLEGLIEHGAVAGLAAHGAALDRLRREADARGATQVLLTVADLDAQFGAYAERSASYDELQVLVLVTELVMRCRVGDASALGIGQPYETAMAKTRLVSLGARLEASGRAVTASVALADTDTGATMKLERRYVPGDHEEKEFILGMPRRPLVPGLSVAATGQGQILTSVAKRRADGLLTLGQGARGRTALLPRDALVRLPAPLLAENVAVVAHRIAERPMAMLRPRDRLGALHLFNVAEMLGQAWSPGSQIWQAAVELEGDGGRLYLARLYDHAAPMALDALSAAFEGRSGPVRQIAGTVRIEDGALICDPWSVATDRLIVPDVADPVGAGGSTPLAPLAPVRSPVEEAQALLASAIHTGRRAFDSAVRTTGPRVVALLETTGHVATAARLSAWLDMRREGSTAFADAAVWIAAMAEDVEPLQDDRIGAA